MCGKQPDPRPSAVGRTSASWTCSGWYACSNRRYTAPLLSCRARARSAGLACIGHEAADAPAQAKQNKVQSASMLGAAHLLKRLDLQAQHVAGPGQCWRAVGSLIERPGGLHDCHVRASQASAPRAATGGHSTAECEVLWGAPPDLTSQIMAFLSSLIQTYRVWAPLMHLTSREAGVWISEPMYTTQTAARERC